VLDTTEISVGDWFQLTITVEHGTGERVVWPDSADFGQFEQLAVEFPDAEPEGDLARSSAHFTLTAFELGDLELPAISVSVVEQDGTEAVLTTSVFVVSVTSVGLDESGDIRDIKGPLEIPRNWLLLLPRLAGALAIGVLAYWLYRRLWGRMVPEDRAVAAATERPAHEVAYEALARLEAKGLLEKGEIKTYVIEASEIVRRYVEGRYHVDALEMATYEVADGLREAGVALDVRLLFDRFLGDCDLVKFAKWVPEMTVCREFVPRASEIVDRTRVEGEREGEEGEGVGAALMSSSPTSPSAPPLGGAGRGATP
jgi:hypothetical protein